MRTRHADSEAQSTHVVHMELAVPASRAAKRKLRNCPPLLDTQGEIAGKQIDLLQALSPDIFDLLLSAMIRISWAFRHNFDILDS